MLSVWHSLGAFISSTAKVASNISLPFVGSTRCRCAFRWPDVCWTRQAPARGLMSSRFDVVNAALSYFSESQVWCLSVVSSRSRPPNVTPSIPPHSLRIIDLLAAPQWSQATSLCSLLTRHDADVPSDGRMFAGRGRRRLAF
jgi:hypothetical protein